MNTRKAHNGAMGLLAALLSLVMAVAMVGACTSRPIGGHVDLRTVAQCPGEWGPGPDRTPIPCAWGPDNGTNGPYVGFDWVLYIHGDTCPATVQDPTTVRCVTESDWSGE